MSAKGEKAAITITTIILSILAVLSVFVIAAWAVVSLADIGPENTAQAYVSTVTTADGSERYFMELEYWENADGKGKEVFEFTFNGYTDWQQQAVLGKGVQYVANEGASGLPSILSGGNWSQAFYDYDERYNTAWASLEGEDLDRAPVRDVSQTIQICAYVLFERGTIRRACGFPVAGNTRPYRRVAFDLRG